MNSELNAWDRFISFFSAKEGFNRARFRAAADLIRKYEGAAKGRRGKNWKANSTSANSEIQQSLPTLRNRARQLVRDNAYAAKGLQVITSNVVGQGIFTQIKVDAAQAREDAGPNSRTKKREAALSRNWKAWAGQTAIDYDGRNNLPGLQRLVLRETVEAGEIFVRRRRTRRRSLICDGIDTELPPLNVQLLESDYLDHNQISMNAKPADGNQIIQGIEYNPRGERVAYHFFTEHPGNFASSTGFTLQRAFETVRVPAEEVAHIYRIDRSGQNRGITWYAPIMFRLKDFDEYEDAQLLRQKIAACFAVFVRDYEGFDATTTPAEGELGEKIEPGIIETLPQGKDVTFANPPTVENYREYTATQLHAIAAGLGITYESLTGDLSEVSFSSARMGFLEMSRNVEEWRNNIVIQQFLHPIFCWWMEGVDLLGMDVSRVRPIFTPPRREMVDPQKETSALKDAVRSGFMSLSEAVRLAGRDPDRHFEEIQKDNQKLDDLGIMVDTDPRKDANRNRLSGQNAPPSDRVE